MENKKYLLFAGHRFYPKGGIRDLHYSSSSIDECKKYFIENAVNIANGSYIDNWCDIVDTSSLKIIASGNAIHGGDFNVVHEVKWKDGNTINEDDWS